MPHRVPLALAMLSALTGCVAAPPKGPLVEYHAGLTPITRPVKCPATYALFATDQPGGPVQIAAHQVGEGQRIGFRRDEDGSVVAVTPTSTLPLPPGAYAWELVPGSVVVRPLRERTREHVQADVQETIEATKKVLLVAGIVVLVVACSAAYGIGQSNSNSARR